MPEKIHQHILKDEITELKNQSSKDKYPKKIRSVVIWNEQNQQTIELITNQFNWSFNTISELYQRRWQVELFF